MDRVAHAKIISPWHSINSHSARWYLVIKPLLYNLLPNENSIDTSLNISNYKDTVFIIIIYINIKEEYVGNRKVF